MMAFSLFMVFSSRILFKIVTLLGILSYNFLILHFHIIYANFYGLRDWLAIGAGLVALMAMDLTLN